jgi:hypothetical protein
MRNLILNSSNIVAGTNNSKFEYVFPAGSVNITNTQSLALVNLTMYYSTPNITATYKNNSFNYIWVDGTTNAVVFPDGFYDIVAIQNYFQFVMLQNGHYLTDSLGKLIFFLTLTANPTKYAIEMNCFFMSQTLATASGWVLPAGVTWVIPTNNIVPMFNILQNNFQQIIGFDYGYYPQGTPPYLPAPITTSGANAPPAQTQAPAYTSTQTYLSAFTPQITPLSSYILTCSLINNNYAIPNNLLTSFQPTGVYGEQFSYTPTQLLFIGCSAGQYDRFSFTITDQNNLPVTILDPNIVILLAISDPNETTSTLKG